MNLRENVMAILNYQPYDRMPIVSFGYWTETLDKWAEEGHVTREEAEDYKLNNDNGPGDRSVMKKLGFDLNWGGQFGGEPTLFPFFEEEELEQRPDGSRVIRDKEGLIVLVKPGVVSIPAEIGTSLTGREAWEELYKPKLQWSPQRIDMKALEALPDEADRTLPLGMSCGSLYGNMRNLLGVEHLSYLYLDDEDLYVEIIDTFGELCYKNVETILASGKKFDFAHFWEDICFKNGPLVNPEVFAQYVGPHYKRITDLLAKHGVNIVSLDCDGKIDALLPIWFENGVNTMFPIEVGTWNASIAPWRQQYGRGLRGIGGMNKSLFAHDRAGIDKEVARLKELVALGGYIPCPDHRIAPDAKFENVQYYCEQLDKVMNG